jgi:hypothetical protein
MAALCGLQFEGKLGTTAMRKYRSFAPPPAVQPRFSCGNRSVAVLCLEPQEPREGVRTIGNLRISVETRVFGAAFGAGWFGAFSPAAVRDIARR